MDKSDTIARLQQKNLLRKKHITYNQLRGGVSSDIFLVSDGVNNIVVKQALKKLKVADEWFADTDRNKVERNFIHYVKTFLPDFIPNILYEDEKYNFFVMEYLDPSYSNWKEQLLEANFDIDTTKKVAEYLADLHIYTADSPEAKTLFHSNEHFISLRIEPYLLTTGDRHPELKEIFFYEANRLQNQKKALIHGDFSPKNIMVRRDRIVLLDHEVACIGDPVFDVAFMLNHLFLKRLYHAGSHEHLPDLVLIFWDHYLSKRNIKKTDPSISETGKLLLLLMLARVDGKSPVAYLGEKHKNFVRTFVYELLRGKSFYLNEINHIWNKELRNQFNEN